MRYFPVFEFEENKCKKLEYYRDLCIGNLYVVKHEENGTEYFLDCVYIGSNPQYSEEGYRQEDNYLFAIINSEKVITVYEPTFRVFLDDSYNIRSRNV